MLSNIEKRNKLKSQQHKNHKRKKKKKIYKLQQKKGHKSSSKRYKRKFPIICLAFHRQEAAIWLKVHQAYGLLNVSIYTNHFCQSKKLIKMKLSLFLKLKKKKEKKKKGKMTQILVIWSPKYPWIPTLEYWIHYIQGAMCPILMLYAFVLPAFL